MKMFCSVFTVTLLAFLPALSVRGQDRVQPASNLPRVGVEILSDTKGVDIGPYLRTTLIDLKNHWSKVAGSGDGANAQHAAISMTIAPDGHVYAMRLEEAARDGSFSKAAWHAAESTHFVTLPSGLKDASLTLRILFSAN